ncbi:hypothetical protein [Paenarthrobacter sp. YJN-5]|uniref:hypothetical protein n=1 Tax=Paenarthrobacter sp. YJN-5 TaxID=2735316 RepID=UPI001877E01D|nr:hypothetical protein [Paenarthrobacter sp. YJN-5]QOT19882.1 hypothetical protein HMI59_24890 [Paenarthrobacter sp. YJN-5]
MSESDGIDEAIEGLTRVGLTVAGRLGEQLSRAREQAMRQAQAAEEQQARELQSRFDAERAAARAQLAPVKDERWWDTASDGSIVKVHATAKAWKDHDPIAQDAAAIIREQVQRRFGVDADNPGADEAMVAAVLNDVERKRGQAAGERNRGQGETLEATLLMAEAAREDRQRERDHAAPPAEDLEKAKAWLLETNPAAAQDWRQRHGFSDTVAEEKRLERDLVADWTKAQDAAPAGDEAEINYDSAERRQALAASLEGVADREAVQARLSADQDQGTPPSAALAHASGRSPKARKARGAGGLSRLLQRGMTR